MSSGYGAPLAKFANSMRDPDPDGARKAARQLWHRMGIAVIFPDDCKGLDRHFIDSTANRIHGTRDKA